MSNLNFYGNIAQYGPDIASYSIKLEIDNSTQFFIGLNNVVSGKVFQTFKVRILDFDNQVMNLDSRSKIMVNHTEQSFIYWKDKIKMEFN